MNIYVILIAGLLVVLMVVFGRHPLEEARKEREQQGSSDPLIHAVEEYNAKKRSLQGFGLPGTGGDGFKTPTPTGYPPYMMNPTPQPQNPYPQNSNSYYPPPPAGTPPSSLQQPRQAQPSQPSQPPS